MLVCLLVYLEYSIFTDAYFPTGKPFKKSWCFIMLLLAATYYLQFFTSKNKSEKIMVLAVGIFITIAMASIIIKQIINNKADTKEIEE
jgi:predicted membrane channel-forming protein YqfA (hemolysin III family)